MTRFLVHRKQGRPGDSGYMLLFLMLAVALLTITMLGVARNYKRGIQRDREVEMIHRGVQYARAVQRYYRKNNRAYPASIEQLEKVNNVRYLRKKYADPMSKDGSWQIAHDTDLLSLTLKPGSGLGLTPATGTGNSTSTTSSTTASQTGSGSDTGSSTGGTTSVTTTSSAILPQGNNTAAGGQVLGGGVMIGVVSKSKVQGIHTFAEKSKYNEWFFIYDPRQDNQKIQIAGPYNPNMIMGTFNTGPVNSNPSTPQTPNTGAPGTVAPSAAPPATAPPVATTPTGTP